MLEEEAPWAALKRGSDEEKAAAGVTLVAALEGARIAAVLLAPVVPALSHRLLTQLGLDTPLSVRPPPHLVPTTAHTLAHALTGGRPVAWQSIARKHGLQSLAAQLPLIHSSVISHACPVDLKRVLAPDAPLCIACTT